MGDGATVGQQLREVPAECQRLFLAVGRLEKAISALEERLGTVLPPSSGTLVASMVAREEAIREPSRLSPPLANRIVRSSLAQQLEGIRTRVETVLAVAERLGQDVEL